MRSRRIIYRPVIIGLFRYGYVTCNRMFCQFLPVLRGFWGKSLVSAQTRSTGFFLGGGL